MLTTSSVNFTCLLNSNRLILTWRDCIKTSLLNVHLPTTSSLLLNRLSCFIFYLDMVKSVLYIYDRSTYSNMKNFCQLNSGVMVAFCFLKYPCLMFTVNYPRLVNGTYT